MTSERRIQNEIRNALAGRGLFFRANVGRAWTGDEIERLTGGRVLIHNARPFDTGLPPGFSDLFGLAPVKIGPQHVDRTLGLFAAIEVKSPTGRARTRQQAFLDAIEREGGLSGLARSPEDALKIIGASW